MHTKTITALLIILQLALPAQVQASCRTVLSPSAQKSEFLSYVERSQPKAHWKRETTWLQESKTATLINATLWVSVVHLLRYSFVEGYEFASWAFTATLLADPILSYLSHFAALVGVNGKLGRALEGKPKTEFISRSLINMGIGVSSITASWSLLGIPFTGEHVLGALGLCAGVYPTLQLTKGFLFETLPGAYEQRTLELLRSKHGNAFYEIEKSVVQRGRDLGFSEKFTKGIYLSAMDAILLSKNYEDSVPATLKLSVPGLERLIENIQATRLSIQYTSTEKETLKNVRRLKRLRRNLVDLLLETGSETANIQDILYIQSPLTPDQFLEFQRDMSKRSHQNKKMMARHSVIDQAIAVGIAGGVFLFQLNHWVEMDALNQ